MPNNPSSTDMVSSAVSKAISVLSVHKLPEKGYKTREEKRKAYMTLAGGILYMSVSSHCPHISKVINLSLNSS